MELMSVDFNKAGNDPLCREALKVYEVGGERINLQLNRNIGENPFGPIASFL